MATGEMANRVVVAIIRRLLNKTQRKWVSILQKVVLQNSKTIRKRINPSRRPGKSLIKPIIYEISLKWKNKNLTN